jgi:hypothetical protein
MGVMHHYDGREGGVSGATPLLPRVARERLAGLRDLHAIVGAKVFARRLT